MIRVLVIEAHPLMRKAICTVLENESDLLVQGAGGSMSELFQSLSKGLPDILLADINLPDMNGMTLLDLLSGQYPELPVLVFSSELGTSQAVKVLQHGALGYLNKTALSSELLNAVRIVSKGQAYLPQPVATFLIRELHKT